MVDINQHTFLTFLKPELAHQLIEQSQTITHNNGTIVFEESDEADDVYLVLAGAVRISKKDPSGNQQLLSIIKENDFFGEYAVLDGKPRSASATIAEEGTVLARIPGPEMLRLFKSSGTDTELKMSMHIIQKVRESNQSKVEELLRQERKSLLGDMTSSIIHDIKNPAYAILLGAGIIADSTESDEIKGYSDIIVKHVRRIETMLNEILDYTRGSPRIDKKETDIGEILSEIEDLHRIFLIDKEIEFKIKPLNQATVIQCDRNKLMRVFQNLIGNASDALNKGEEITLECITADNSIQFVLKDTGPGIPEELQATLFDPFTTKGKSRGTGLGMAVTKSIVEAHDGTLSFVTSKEKGTTFFITLPKN